MARRSPTEVAAGAAVLLVAAGFLFYALATSGRSTAGGMHLNARFAIVGDVSPGSDVRLAGV